MDDFVDSSRRKPYRIKWQVGRTYAVQPGRGKPAVARIRLKQIRQESVQDIRADDVIAEGIIGGREPADLVASFAALWNRIHKRRGERWEDNPPVWVLEFELVDE